MKTLREVIEEVLEDVHIESGRKSEHKEVVDKLECAIVKAIEDQVINPMQTDCITK